MGTYGVSAEELKPKLEKFLSELEGDTNAEELAKAYHMISKEHDFGDILIFRWMLKDMKDSNRSIADQIEESGVKPKWLGE